MSHAECQPMGLGRLASASFGRKFRFTLRGTTLPAEAVQRVSIDYTNKTLTLTCIDVAFDDEHRFESLKWSCQPMNGEILVLRTFDGIGLPLYTVTFKGLSIVSHTSEYDYSSSDISEQKYVVHYNDCVMTVEQRQHYTEIVPERPSVNTKFSATADETWLRFLNGALTVAGKVLTKGKTV